MWFRGEASLGFRIQSSGGVARRRSFRVSFKALIQAVSWATRGTCTGPLVGNVISTSHSWTSHYQEHGWMNWHPMAPFPMCWGRKRKHLYEFQQNFLGN